MNLCDFCISRCLYRIVLYFSFRYIPGGFYCCLDIKTPGRIAGCQSLQWWLASRNRYDPLDHLANDRGNKKLCISEGSAYIWEQNFRTKDFVWQRHILHTYHQNISMSTSTLRHCLTRERTDCRNSCGKRWKFFSIILSNRCVFNL